MVKNKNQQKNQDILNDLDQPATKGLCMHKLQNNYQDNSNDLDQNKSKID
jgi:hypothetical protein